MNKTIEKISAPMLPFSKEVAKKWSYIYAYNLKTIRDIFIYVNSNKGLYESDLYKAMDNNLIPPPKSKWINPNTKRENRLKLEYVHATKYLDLIKKEGDKIVPSFDTYSVEKNILINENIKSIENKQDSYSFTDKEIQALIPIVINYERAKDFLWWFLDFNKYKSPNDFSLTDFFKYGKPIFIQRHSSGKKTGDYIKREVDNSIWRIPVEKNFSENGKTRMDDYGRLVSFVFPNWFSDLAIIGRIYIFREISKDKQSWLMCYPLHKNKQISINEVKKFIEYKFIKSNEQDQIVIPIPKIILEIAKKYMISVSKIKRIIIELHQSEISKFVLERSSLQVMKHAKELRYSKTSMAQDMYIKYNGFYRSSLIINRNSKQF